MDEMNQFDLMDEDAMVAFIRNKAKEKLGEHFLDSLSDDDIIYIIDIAYEYYDENGLLEIELDEEKEVVEVDKEDLLDYIRKALKKDNDLSVDSEQLEAIVTFENDYIDQIASLEDQE